MTAYGKRNLFSEKVIRLPFLLSLNAAAWSLYYVVSLFLFYPLWDMQTQQFLTLLLTYAVGFVISGSLLFIYKAFSFPKQFQMKTSLLMVLYSLPSALLWLVMDDFLTGLVFGFHRTLLPEFFTAANIFLIELFRYFLIMLIWHAVYYLLHLNVIYIRQRERVDAAEQLLRETELKMLRYQLTPHFLFNSLNSIRALILKEPQKAREMVSELSEFLKVTLTIKPNSEIPLREELEIVSHYLRLEKTRFEEKLQIAMTVKPAAEEFPVPALLLHPLIENALKYGRGGEGGVLHLEIEASVKESGLQIRIYNSGSWVNNSKVESRAAGSTNTGLENIRKRLYNSYGSNAGIEVKETESGVEAVIFIQKEVPETDE